MLNNLKLDKVLFLDIETVPQQSSYKDLSERMSGLWDKKAKQLTQREGVSQSAEEIYNRAGIYSEFGKIVCISLGMIHGEDKNLEFRLKSFYGDDEKKLRRVRKTFKYILQQSR